MFHRQVRFFSCFRSRFRFGHSRRPALIALSALLFGAVLDAAGSRAVGSSVVGTASATSETAEEGPPAESRPDLAAISRALPPLPTTERGWRIPLDGSGAAKWTPIRDGVRVESSRASNGDSAEAEPATLSIEYTRAPRTASGVAIVTPVGAFEDLDALVIRAAATPNQRLFVTLTDGDGIVWTLPTLRLTAEESNHTLRVADLAPDAFQNQGKSVPAEPDMTSIVMLTILDISGHMGAPAEECAWTISGIEGLRR